jgi:hypothetical protein
LRERKDQKLFLGGLSITSEAGADEQGNCSSSCLGPPLLADAAV